MALSYNVLDQSMVTSMVVDLKDFDSFFSPTLYQHTGFAADGQHYSNGEITATPVATWYSENPGILRGTSPAFPKQALILVSKAALSIFDTSSQKLVMWMVFLVGDNFGLPINPRGASVSYEPSHTTWANGVITLVSKPSAGSTDQTCTAVHIDFIRDTISFEQSGLVS